MLWDNIAHEHCEITLWSVRLKYILENAGVSCVLCRQVTYYSESSSNDLDEFLAGGRAFGFPALCPYCAYERRKYSSIFERVHNVTWPVSDEQIRLKTLYWLSRLLERREKVVDRSHMRAVYRDEDDPEILLKIRDCRKSRGSRTRAMKRGDEFLNEEYRPDTETLEKQIDWPLEGADQ
jgi:hypothetical protein